MHGEIDSRDPPWQCQYRIDVAAVGALHAIRSVDGKVPEGLCHGYAIEQL